MSMIKFNPKTGQLEEPDKTPELPKGDKIYVVTKIISSIKSRTFDKNAQREIFRSQSISSDKIGLIGMLPVFSSIDAALAYCGDPDLILTLTAK